MGKLIALDAKPDGVTPETFVVETLREMLAQAEKGDIRAFACVTICKDNSVGQAYVGEVGSNVFTIVGALEASKLDLLDRFTERD